MLTYSNIVVGTDGSATSLRAVRTAASLARVYEARLIIVSAFFNHSSSMLGATGSDNTGVPVISEDMAKDFLANALKVAEEEKACNVEIVGRPGDPVKALLAAGEDFDVDLFVVGNKGFNSMRGRVFGSVAKDLTRRAHVDVLVADTTD